MAPLHRRVARRTVARRTGQSELGLIAKTIYMRPDPCRAHEVLQRDGFLEAGRESVQAREALKALAASSKRRLTGTSAFHVIPEERLDLTESQHRLKRFRPPLTS